MNIPETYVDPVDNEPAKAIKTSGVSAKKKNVDFNGDVHVKYIPKITGVQTKSAKLARHAKNRTS